MSAVSIPSTKPGRTFVRGLIARAVAEGNPEEYANRRWGIGTGAIVAKAALGAVASSNGEPAREFLAAAMERSLLGRIPGLKRVPPNIRMASFSTRPGAAWVPEGAAIPLSKPAVAGRSLRPLKVAGILAMTNESLKAYGETVEAAIQSDLETAVAGMIDLAFADPTNAGVSDESPAGIAYSATTISTTGTLKGDVEAAFNAYEGNIRDAVFLMNPRVAVQIATSAAQLGDSKLGANGGTLVGVPVVTTEGVPITSGGSSLILLDAGAVRYAFSGVSIYRSTEATLQMADDPDGDSVTPDAGQIQHVSLFQSNTTAFKADAEAAWTLESAGRAVVVEDVDYAAEA